MLVWLCEYVGEACVGVLVWCVNGYGGGVCVYGCGMCL